MSLSRLHHRLPGREAHPEVVQGTTDVHHQIADALLPQADAVFDDATALHTAVDMLDPQPTVVQGLVGQLLCQGAFLAPWLLGRHADLDLGQRKRQEAQILQLGCQINTAFIERLNLTIRQQVAAVGRRVTTRCKGEEELRQQLALYQTYYNFCLPHASLRQALPQLELTDGTGSAKQWRPCTPAMSAELTDRVWTLRDVLLYRVPPWPQPQEL